MKAKSNRGQKGASIQVIVAPSFVKGNVEQSCSQRAGLDGVTLHWLRSRKLAEKLRFYVAQKKSGRISATIVVKLLTVVKLHTETKLRGQCDHKFITKGPFETP